MIIHPHDVQNLIGKFIIQLSEKHIAYGDKILNNESWNFFKEKRISFVGRGNKGTAIELQGFYYKHNSFTTDAEFIEYFNNYYTDSTDKRFHRLLTNDELEFVFKKLKEGNSL